MGLAHTQPHPILGAQCPVAEASSSMAQMQILGCSEKTSGGLQSCCKLGLLPCMSLQLWPCLIVSLSGSDPGLLT